MVDLPEPEGPMIVTFSPAATSKSSSSSTVIGPKRLHDLVELDDRLGHFSGIPIFGRA